MVEQDKLETLDVLKTPYAAKLLAKVFLGLAFLLIIILFLPWQQNIRASGTLTALSPSNRPQIVPAIISGRIEDWKVQEGQFVNAGDTLLTLSEIKDYYWDPQLIFRMEEQVAAKGSSLMAKQQKAEALRRQIIALKSAAKIKQEQAQNKVSQSALKVVSDSMNYEMEKLNYTIAEEQFKRQQALYEQGLKSLTELEMRKLKLQESSAKRVSEENKFLVSKNEYMNALIELNAVQADYQDKISKAESELGATLSDQFDTEGGIAKLKNELTNIQIRNNQYDIVAPQDGFVVKALKQGVGETIKEGEGVVTIMPDTLDIAVELYVKAMDIPLLSKGRKVRLEFDGWPALQFSGWPGLSFGTFGGKIEVIDMVGSSNGSYRVLVVPDKKDDPWPKQLRIGTGVYAWAMLDEVPIWKELWRQLNGFPPNMPDDGTEVKTAKTEKSKL